MSGNIDLMQKMLEVDLLGSDMKSLHPPEEKRPLAADSNNNDGQTIRIKIPVEIVRHSTSWLPCVSGEKPNELPWLACRVRGFGISLLLLSLAMIVPLILMLCCGAYFSKAMAVTGYCAVAVTFLAAAQTLWQVGCLDSRGTTHVKVCVSKLLQLTAMGVNLGVVILAIFYTASEPECRPVNNNGDLLPASATTPPGGPTCYADFFSNCYIQLAAVIVVGGFQFVFGLMLVEKLWRIGDRMRGK